MLKVPSLRGKFVCGPCNNPEATYTAHEHLISYRLPRHECITINGLAAFCDVCGKYAKISAIEDYNAELAEEAYAHPELAQAAVSSTEDSNIENSEVPAEASSIAEDMSSPALSVMEDDSFNDYYSEDSSGQMEFTDLIGNM
ncbi:MAG: hypothetical protein K5894_04480 [Lachnospiraceae bacterium]|nr:hypothetical protein [Lachnospiraceae bacterium]